MKNLLWIAIFLLQIIAYNTLSAADKVKLDTFLDTAGSILLPIAILVVIVVAVIWVNRHFQEKREQERQLAAENTPERLRKRAEAHQRHMDRLAAKQMRTARTDTARSGLLD